MNYISTRGEAPPLGFEDVVLAGLARDGGLYVPQAWPVLAPETIASFAGMPFADVAVEVIYPFTGGSISRDRAAPHDHRSLCALRPSGGDAAGAGGDQPLDPRAVPRADAGLQGRRDAAAGASHGPRAGRTRTAGDDHRRHVGRYGRRGHRSFPRLAARRRGDPLSRRARLRRAAAHDDDADRGERACRSRCAARSTTARRS